MKKQCSVMPIDPAAGSLVPKPHSFTIDNGGNKRMNHPGTINSKPVTTKRKTKQKH